MGYKPKVIVCPLDWGLGHATRCIPVIRELLAQGAEVVIAGDGPGMNLLGEEFTELKTVNIKGYGISFSGKLPVGAYLFLSAPRFMLRVYREHKQLSELVSTIGADAIIADNRYGLWHDGIYSVFITHQPNIIPPVWLNFTKPLLRRITRFFISKYDECWIPDFLNPPGLSGNLSHGFALPENVEFIGPLSRLDYEKSQTDASLYNQSESYELVAIISGPEPHRTQFEELLIEQLKESKLKSLLVRGITNIVSSPVVKGNLTIINHMRSSEMYRVLIQSNVVICRAGYSTLMDLSVTGNKVICIPTPGQSEQEYLAESLSAQGYAISCSEKNFNLNECYNKVLKTKRLPVGSGMLAAAVELMLKKQSQRNKSN